MKKVFFTITFFAVLSLFQQVTWAADGAAIYKARCAPCHGAKGQGTAMAPSFSAFIGKSSIEEISDVISKGRNGSDKKYKNFAIGMPRQGLNHDEIIAVVGYLKNLSGFGESKVELDVKAVIETKYGDITIKFFPEKAPGHVANFVKLAGKVFMTALYSTG